MTNNPGKLFWIELGLSAAAAALAILTLITREWIELLTGWDPDHGSGSLEWSLAVGLVVIALILAALARLEYRRSHPATNI
ncbi:DUF202 domain-containing protein [Streptomyces sp. SID13031]|uniref:DUF202 domain-containing protein n=1 Tax=Streptomyces sp. SID13031 TaxID=2706046 RepID=UPI0013C88A59|nr:DUF202 domain-containing protein [Streptomyces sp. SID13031]NEA30677.1 ABC transporter permease [Streptomyces sp. SID13031]